MSITDQQIVAYIEQIFARYDWDHSGTLDAAQLTVFFNDLYRMMGINQVVSVPEAQQALKLIDTNFDGRASKAQLFEAFRGTLQKQGYYVNGQVYINSGTNYNQLMTMIGQNPQQFQQPIYPQYSVNPQNANYIQNPTYVQNTNQIQSPNYIPNHNYVQSPNYVQTPQMQTNYVQNPTYPQSPTYPQNQSYVQPVYVQNPQPMYVQNPQYVQNTHQPVQPQYANSQYQNQNWQNQF